jgi:hypothetical protein
MERKTNGTGSKKDKKGETGLKIGYSQKNKAERGRAERKNSGFFRPGDFSFALENSLVQSRPNPPQRD